MKNMHTTVPATIDEVVDSIIRIDHPEMAAADPIPETEENTKLRLQIKQSFNDYINRIKHGIQVLVDAKKLTPELIDIQKVAHILDKHGLRFMHLGRLFQEELGFSNDTVFNFYLEADHAFERKNYSEAADILLFLTVLNPLVPSFWLTLGLAEEAMAKYEDAIMAYRMVIGLNEADLLPILYCAECHKQLHQTEQARQMLDLAIERSADKSEFADIKQKAALMKNHL